MSETAIGIAVEEFEKASGCEGDDCEVSGSAYRLAMAVHDQLCEGMQLLSGCDVRRCRVHQEILAAFGKMISPQL